MRFEVVDARTVRAEDGATYDVLDAIKQLSWTPQLCPFMPHEYAILQRSPEVPWFALEAMVSTSPDGFRAYFRGYPRPNRYWDAPDGMRYWRGRFELDRCASGGRELRRVDEGAKPIRDWDGPPWAPSHIGLYQKEGDGKWWPRFQGTDLAPCKACVNRAHPWPDPIG